MIARIIFNKIDNDQIDFQKFKDKICPREAIETKDNSANHAVQQDSIEAKRYLEAGAVMNSL